MNRLKRRIRKILGLKKPESHWRKSYAQEGEDLVLSRFFDDSPDHKGYYVDVGAHHPTRFSNTKLFYDRGWRGINIDPRPGFAKQFLAARPNDVAIESAVADRPGVMTYYMFDEPALNGFDEQLSRSRNQETHYRILNTEAVQVQPLTKILDQNLPPHQKIDFLSIDVEGLDYEVLSSNDWKRYRPTFVLVEIYGESLDDVSAARSSVYLEQQHYVACSRTRHTVIFRDRQSISAAKAA